MTKRNTDGEEREMPRGHFFMFFFYMYIDRWTLQGVGRVTQYIVLQKDKYTVAVAIFKNTEVNHNI